MLVFFLSVCPSTVQQQTFLVLVNFFFVIQWKHNVIWKGSFKLTTSAQPQVLNYNHIWLLSLKSTIELLKFSIFNLAVPELLLYVGLPKKKIKQKKNLKNKRKLKKKEKIEVLKQKIYVLCIQ